MGRVSGSDQEIQHIHAGRGLGAVELGVTAVCAADGDELLVLDIEYFGKIAAGRLELVADIFAAAAHGADIISLFHRALLSRCRYMPVYPYPITSSGFWQAGG